MTTPPVIPSQQHTKSEENPQYWEEILRDAGLPSEPHPQHNTSPLFSDSLKDFGDERSFFDKYSYAIFEAKYERTRKDVPASVCVCQFCGIRFYERAGTKFCCSNHRKRHDEGKEYKHVMCEGDGCGREVFPVFESFVAVDGKKLCGWCAWLKKHTGWTRAQMDLFAQIRKAIWEGVSQ
jgi:hypothetical protein